MEVTISFNNKQLEKNNSNYLMKTSVKVNADKNSDMRRNISALSKVSGSSRNFQHVKNASEIKNRFKDINLKLKENANAIEIGYNKESLPEITEKLVSLGYSLESVNLAYNRYKFKSIDQALMIMGLDPETGFYHHQFYQKKRNLNEFGDEILDDEDDYIKNAVNATQPWNNKTKSNLCIICRDIKEKHFDFYSENNNFSKNNFPIPKLLSSKEANNSNSSSYLQETHNNLLQTKEYKSSRVDLNILQKQINQKAKIDPTFLEQLENEFKNKNLCIICYSQEMSQENSYKLACGHTFCTDCINNYLTNLILESKVENIKCLQAGCITNFPELSIKENVSTEIYSKYLKFKRRSTFLENLQKGFLPCTAPDCEEWVSYREGDNPFVECEMGHKFCVKCKEGWHKRGNCRNKNVERLLKSSTRIRTCPSCGNFIEKEGGCNHMVCTICNYEFCWLCMRKYEYYHYYVFNMKGCPGMRFANLKNKNSIWNNPLFKCLWCLLTIVLGILAVGVIILFWVFFGATYELIKCYYDKKTDNNEEEYDENSVQFEMEFQNPSYIRERVSNHQSSNIQVDNSKLTQSKSHICLVYTGFTILGLLIQPIYLIFKFIELIMECYRKYGCWYYY